MIAKKPTQDVIRGGYRFTAKIMLFRRTAGSAAAADY
jgi:hypothetical protein